MSQLAITWKTVHSAERVKFLYAGVWGTTMPHDGGLPRVLCVEGQFTCRSVGCVDAEHVCDGQKDCPDGSDEDRCGTLATFTRMPICFSANSFP